MQNLKNFTFLSIFLALISGALSGCNEITAEDLGINLSDSNFNWSAICSGKTKYNDLGSGTQAAPYIICNGTQLSDIGNAANFPNSLTAHYRQVQDIDLSSFTGNSFNIIGNNTPPNVFKGTYDGNNNVIEGLNYNDYTMSQVGLFRYIQGDGTIDGTNDGHIKNLILIDNELKADAEAGILVGHAETAKIENVVVIGGYVEIDNTTAGGLAGYARSNTQIQNVTVVTGVLGSASNNQLGGIAGVLNSSNILNSSMAGFVITSGNLVGGLVGNLSNSASITESYSTALVEGGNSTGGLVGDMSGAASTLSETYHRGHIYHSSSGTYSNLGGLVGYMQDGTISDSYSQHMIDSDESGVGGLIGRMDAGTIESTYSYGIIDGGATSTGGLISNYTGGTISSTYPSVWNGTKNSHLDGDSSGGDLTNVARFLKHQFDGTNVLDKLGWDQTNTWKANGNSVGPPLLKFQPSNFSIDRALGKFAKAGWSNHTSYGVSGNCTTNGETIYITGPVEGSTTCSGNRWSTTLDFSSETDDFVLVLAHEGELDYGSMNMDQLTVDLNADLCDPSGSPTWDNTDEVTYPYRSGAGTSGDPYVICTAKQFNTIRTGPIGNNTGIYFKLGDHIDMSAITPPHSPLGTSGDAFEATLDGHGYSITGWTNNSGGSDLGIFGYCSGANIWALEIIDLSITGSDDVGGLCGESSGGGIGEVYFGSGNSITATGDNIGMAIGWGNSWIEDSHFQGTINLSSSSTDYVGGAVGKYYTGTNITNISTDVDIIATDLGGYVGGIIGYMGGTSETAKFKGNASHGDITVSTSNATGTNIGGLIGRIDGTSTYSLNVYDSFASGSVTVSNTSNKFGYVGGAIGVVIGSGSATIDIDSVHALGNVKNDITNSNATGGLIGIFSYGTNHTLSNSFAEGDVRGYDDTGGLVGKSEAVILNSYATGDVIAGSGVNVGGLIGEMYQSTTYNTEIDSCYALGDVTGSDYIGGLVGHMNDSGGAGTTRAFDSFHSGAIQSTTASTFTGYLFGDTTGTTTTSNLDYDSDNSTCTTTGPACNTNYATATTSSDLQSGNTGAATDSWSSTDWSIQSGSWPFLHD